ncbi:MAG: hypothetical protein CFH40_00582, partial [Alphaproteobacteria bacterium MarineAlpha10_Bin3]
AGMGAIARFLGNELRRKATLPAAAE